MNRRKLFALPLLLLPLPAIAAPAREVKIWLKGGSVSRASLEHLREGLGQTIPISKLSNNERLGVMYRALADTSTDGELGKTMFEIHHRIAEGVRNRIEKS